MTSIGKKIFSIIQSKHSSFDQDRVSAEIEELDKTDTCKDVLDVYNAISKTGVGEENSLNSMVCYLLGITKKKPDGPFNLEKRRTYGRVGFPDVDMDFDYERRHEIVDYITKKYGEDRVVKIGTVQTLKEKSALRRVIKVLDPCNSVAFDTHGNKIKNDESENFRLQNEICGSLPDLMKRANGTLVSGLEEAYKEYSGFRRYMDSYPEVFRVAKRIEGSISAQGVHAAGLCVSPVPICTIAPLHTTRDMGGDGGSGEKVIATQFSMKDIELLGLIKFDILGLSTKTAVSLAVKLIKQNSGHEVDTTNLPLDDRKTLDLLSSGHTDLIFQLENYGMKQTLRQIGISSFDDLVAAIALYRPGPKDFIPEFARRKKNPSTIKYLHPIIKKHTEKTYGIIVYQESVMQIYVEMANLSPTEGYGFIKGSAKKDPKLFNSMKARFIEGATKNVGSAIANKVWDFFQPFIGYGFNAAHAYSYGYESYKTAYLKANYPIEFFAARLSVESQRGKFEAVEKYEQDATQNFGITILPVSLQHSKLNYSIVDDKTLRRPLRIKGIGDAAASDIIAHQPYKESELLYSFAMRTGSCVNAKAVEALHAAGLFGKEKKEKLLRDFEQLRKDKKSAKGRPVRDAFV